MTAIRVRTCKTIAEFREAAGAISEYGAWDVDEETAERFLRCHPLDRMHAAFFAGDLRARDGYSASG